MSVVRPIDPRENDSPEIFWGEIAPCEHMVQLYDDDEAFLERLGGFVGSGLQQGDSVVVIGTGGHLKALDHRLASTGIDVQEARAQDRYIVRDAEATLRQFMVGGRPDHGRFRSVVEELLQRARFGGRRVRAFGEMVAVLWARGGHEATLQLETLWHRLCHEEKFPLLCAYPANGFTQDVRVSLDQIRATHSRVLD